MGQIVANQRAYTRDLNQFAIQGIPIYTELAKVIGVNGEEIRKMVEAGSIGYDQVSQALKNMTADGTAFNQIAKEMDATFSAKMEAIGSAIETLAGRFMNMINAFDRATGGLVSGSLGMLVSGLNLAGDAMEFLASNAKQLAPVLGGLAGAVAAVSFLTIAQNIGSIIAAMATWKITTIAVTAANWLLYASQLAVQAAMGNMPVVIGAIAVAATGATIAANMMGDALEGTNTAMQANQELAKASGDEMDSWAWKVEGLPGKLKAAMNSMKTDWESYRAELKQVQTEQDQLMADVEASSKAELDGIKDVIKEIKEKQKVLREAHSDQMKDLRERHTEEMKAIDKEIAAERKKHDARMGLLDQEGPAEKQLAAYRREELEMTAKGIDFKEDELRLQHKKKLEAQAELDRLDRRAAMDKEKLQHDEKMVQLEKEKKDLQEQQGQEKDKLAKQQENEADHLKEMEKLQEWNYENTKKRWDDLKQQQNDMWTEDKANSNLSIDQANYRTDYLITLENEIRDAMVKKWNDATVAMNRHYDQRDRRANAPSGGDGAGRASGGPVSGGTTYTVNELGKEAFLSASGKLSMINAPSYGQWKAPSSGTVIPAHLTSQLDIPVGGININKTASMNGRGIGGVRPAAISHGDNIMNNVTVQSTNPSKAASDMLVSMTKIRRRRLR
jgi:tape measure domain-containing protein